MNKAVSVVIPAYNERSSIRGVLDEISRRLTDENLQWEIVVVDDGSADGTADVVSESNDERVRLIRHERNMGSGRAIRTGIDNARHELILFVPADGQFDPNDVPAFVKAADDADVVIGRRAGRVGYGLWRKIQSAVYIKLVNTLFRQSYGDVNWVQCWRKSTAGRITMQSTSPFMQQEMIAKASAAGMRVAEIPSNFRPRETGSAKGGNLRTIVVTLRDMFRFYFKSNQ